MLRRIVSIRNLGRFRDFPAPGSPELSRNVLMLGANGSGKTTLSRVFRSLASSDPSYIDGLRHVGVGDPQAVELLFADRTARFDGQAWSAVYPAIAVFDERFVDESVRLGPVIEAGHESDGPGIVVGDVGVRLVDELASLAEQGRRKAGDIAAAEREIRRHVPNSMTLTEFLALPAEPDLDERIAEGERLLAAVGRVEDMRRRPLLSALALPTVPEGLEDLLARPMEPIAPESEAHLAEHFAAHGLGADGRDWILKGLDHAGSGTCPFCGNDIRDLPLIATYRASFGVRYRLLGDELDDMRRQLDRQFGEAAVDRLKVHAEKNQSAIEFWSRYCTFDPLALAYDDSIFAALLGFGEAALAMLDRKVQAPLEALKPDEAFGRASAALQTARRRAQEIAAATDTANATIAAAREEIQTADIAAVGGELARLRAVEARHLEPLATLCTDYARLTEERRDLDDRRDSIRAQLADHTGATMGQHLELLNGYLDGFNATFRLARVTAGDAEDDGAASSYRLVIETTIDLGRNETARDGARFTHTLGSGDRTTLAFAYFFAMLTQDHALADKIVVFDDPARGQDAFRRRRTVHEITQLAGKCAQVIVLSHDAAFLRQLWEKAPPDDRIALTLADHHPRGSKIVHLDLPGASKGRTEADLDDLQGYVTAGAGKPLDMIRKMRVVLEAYCWTTYPGFFEPGHDSLSDIVVEIAEAGDQHPATDLYEELDRINDYTSRYHHGHGSTYGALEPIDPSELTTYVRSTLQIVNALQA